MNVNRKPFYLYVFSMVAALLLVLVLLAWRVMGSIETFEGIQLQQAQNQAKASRNTIESLVLSIRERMQAVVDDDFLSTDLNLLQHSDAAQAHLKKRLMRYFPEMYSYSILAEDGSILVGNLDFEMGEVCFSDIDASKNALFHLTRPSAYRPMIHPKFEAYHFDMLLPLKRSDGRFLFFLNFHATLLVKALQQQKVSPLAVYLVRRDSPSLIEVGYEGVRDTFKRPIYLTGAERASILAKERVSGTLWDVVVLVPNDYLAEYKHRRWLDFGMAATLVFLLWSVVFYGLLRYEKTRASWVEKLSFMSMHDPLTGAANRRKLEESLADWLQRYQGEERFLGLLYLDLNDFKPINDLYGHPAGDELLKQLVVRIQSQCRQHDMVARMGGDEFVVMMDHLGTSREDAYINLALLTAQCHDTINDYFEIEHQRIVVTASIGTLLIDPSFSFDQALKEADELMYRAKQSYKEP